MTERVQSTAKNGQTFFIEGDFLDRIEAFDERGKRIAELSFDEKDNGYPGTEYIEFMFAEVDESWRRQGVAKQCFLYAVEHIVGEHPIAAPSRLDRMKNHGNMLTEDGLAFVTALREEGLIAPDPADRPDDRSDEFDDVF